MKRDVLILVFLGFIILVCIFIFSLKKDTNSFDNNSSVVCVPDSCCHATGCILESEALDCTNIMCTQICLGPLDCGAGHCKYISGNCEVVQDE